MGTRNNAGRDDRAGGGADVPGGAGRRARAPRPGGRAGEGGTAEGPGGRTAADGRTYGRTADGRGRELGADTPGTARPGEAPRAGVERQAQVRIYVGATGSGKSTALKRTLDGAPAAWRIIVDPDGEYYRYGLRCSSLADLVNRVQGGRGSLVFVPSLDRATAIRQFAFCCAVAWRIAERGRPVHFVVDELSEFTTAIEAPHEWRRLVKRGRKAGITIDAAAQRPAEIDKTIWSNATLIRSGRLNFAADQSVIAAALGVGVDQVIALGQLDYLERDRNTGELRRGHLTF